MFITLIKRYLISLITCKLNVRTVCYYHVTYAFQSESTLHSWLNVKEFLAQNKRNIWSLSDSNRIRTHNYLVHKWLSIRLRTKWFGFEYRCFHSNVLALLSDLNHLYSFYIGRLIHYLDWIPLCVEWNLHCQDWIGR